jgi:hypothetical protein
MVFFTSSELVSLTLSVLIDDNLNFEGHMVYNAKNQDILFGISLFFCLAVAPFLINRYFIFDPIYKGLIANEHA